MSDFPQGEGWWLASDQKWYPPTQRPGAPLPPPPGQSAPTGPASGYPQPVRTNGEAIASLVCGLLWMFGLGAVLALIFGYRAKNEIDRSQGTQEGRGLAIAGIVLGWIGLAGLLFVFAIGSVSFLGDTADTQFRQTGEEIGRLGDGINTDPPDGVCDFERFMQDPDC